jgi:glycosyltransferase involved in cell wall biosynthesis
VSSATAEGGRETGSDNFRFLDQAPPAVADGGDPAGQPVAINARAAVRAEIGGVERLAREMAMRLPALRPDRYRVIRPPAALAHRAGHAWEQAVLPLKAARCDLLYSPANLAPVLDHRNVLVLHDVAALRHPEAYSRAYVGYQRRLLPRLARRARLLITVSDFSRREIAEVLEVPAQRVRVIPEGVDQRFTPDADPAPARRRHRLDRSYAVAVGTVSKRKNLRILEPAARALNARGVDLVVAGSGRGYLHEGELSLRRLGYVRERDLPGLYAGALAVVVPSRYEGFGLPCLEAMACGTPVLAARAAALPETVGGAAILLDPDDSEGFATALLDVAFDEDLRTTLARAGLQRARGYSWERTSRLTDEAIAALLSQPERPAAGPG